jgi:hypothetical protein
LPASPLYVNETHRPLSVTFLDDSNTALNLTTATLSVRFGGVGTSVSFTGAGTFNITNATAGLFTYTFAAGDVANPGSWNLQFIATYGDGTKQFSDPVPLEILADL